MGPLISGSLCMPPCSLSLLFSTNKIFLTSAAGDHLCFHSQSGPKNPQLLKIPASSVYYLATYEGTLSHLRSVQVVANWMGFPRQWPWSPGTLMKSVLQESPPTTP
jgi:hypothetical protein